MQNRNGAIGDMAMLVIFIFVMIIIGAGIAAGVIMVFGQGYDFKNADAEILSYKVEGCLVENGFENLAREFYSVCGLNERVIEENYVLRICQGFNIEACYNGETELFSIGTNFQLCGIEGYTEREDIVKCHVKRVSDGEGYLLITGANQEIRRSG